MFDIMEKRKELSKWIVEIIVLCILIYLGIRHIRHIVGVIGWFASLVSPLLIGIILALILNVPMMFWETRFLSKTPLKKGKRIVSIILALALVLGLFIGVSVLVIPELMEAVKLMIQILVEGIDQLAHLEENSTLKENTIGKFLSELDIDWIGLKVKLEEWFRLQSGTLINQVVGATEVVVSKIVTFFIGVIFSIYILAKKELLKCQVCRLVRAWLPKKFGESLIHISVLCSETFRLFIAGQAMEAIILGTLCMIGMIILQIPYAPMIGALIGVTALIPIAGAFVGTIVGTIMIMTVHPFKAVVFVVFLMILQQVEGNLIYPRVVGSKIKLPAIWVLAAVTTGGNFAGPLGMLLGVPAASVAYTLLREATEKREQHNL